jgi:hypothetical protein
MTVTATPREIATFVSGALGASGWIGLNVDRALQESGYREKSHGRGMSARPATARDAAGVIIAIAAAPLFSSTTAKAIETFETFSALPFDDATLAVKAIWDSAYPSLAALSTDHTFVDGLAALLKALASGELPADAFGLGRVGVEISAPWPRAEIVITGVRAAGAIYCTRPKSDDHVGFKAWCAENAKTFGMGLPTTRRLPETMLRDIAAMLKAGD